MADLHQPLGPCCVTQDAGTQSSPVKQLGFLPAIHYTPPSHNERTKNRLVLEMASHVTVSGNQSEDTKGPLNSQSSQEKPPLLNMQENVDVSDVHGSENREQPASGTLTDESVTDEPQTDEESELKLTDLPDEVLVNVMEYLNLSDRYHLTMTCQLFHELFSHPQLWKVAHIILMTHQKNPHNHPLRWKLPSKSMMHHTMATIVHKFGHLFQHLVLDLQGFIQPFDNNCKTLLQLLNKQCRLESLSIKLGSLPSSDVYVNWRSTQLSNYSDLPLVVGLIQNAVRLKRLALVSWPFHEQTHDSKDIFEALMNNKRFDNLESLSLFFPKLKPNQWTDRIPRLPSPDLTLTLLSSLRNISHLALRSPMISNELLQQLACSKRTPLASLQVLIMCSRDSVLMEGFKIPDLSPKAWSDLRKASPELNVEFVMFSRVPEKAVGVLLQPEVQLSSFQILEYGRCDAELVYTLAERYSGTLRQFVSYCDCSSCDDALLKLVKSCDLTHLVYYGDVGYRTVMEIATAVNKLQMELKRFEFRAKNILTDEPEVDDDVVVGRDEERYEYYLAAVRSWHEDDLQRHNKLDKMAEYVSKMVGYHWYAVS